MGRKFKERLTIFTGISISFNNSVVFFTQCENLNCSKHKCILIKTIKAILRYVVFRVLGEPLQSSINPMFIALSNNIIWSAKPT